MIAAMADDAKPTATVLRIKVRHPDVDAFIERFATQVTRTGVFIPTRTPKPVGTEVRFEIRTADDKPVLVGQGQVRLTRAHDPAQPRMVAGMAVELQRVGRDSRDVLLRMLEVRKRRGLHDGPGGMPMPGDPEPEVTDEVTTARAPRARTASVAPAPVAEPLAIAPPVPAPPSVIALAPARARRALTADLAAQAVEVAPLDDDLDAWPEAQRPLPEVLARARALVGDDLESELAAVAVPSPVVDLATARTAAAAAMGRPLRTTTARADRSAPLPVPRGVQAVATAMIAGAPVEVAPIVPAPVEVAPIVPAPIVPAAADAAAPTPVFDESTVIEGRAYVAAIAPTEAPTATDTEVLRTAVATESAEAASRARAARAQRERAKREANDRALRERNQRIQRELAERAQRGRAVQVPPRDPLADLDLDEPLPQPPGETTRRVDLAAMTTDPTRRVDAAALAAEALDAADLRSSLADPSAELQFLETLSLDDAPAPRRRTPHTVSRAATAAPRPAVTIPPAPHAPPPSAAVPPPAAAEVDLDDDDSVDISIEFE